MKYSFLLVSIMLFSCSIKEEHTGSKAATQIVKQKFQSILDSSNVEGTLLIFDFERNTFYSNDFEKTQQGHLPASTFKITHAIIGLEAGAIKNKKSIFKWDGEKRFLSSWEKDLNLQQAFQLSCVPCFQSVAQNIGVEKMNVFLKKLTYGKMDVNTNTLDNFWLEGSSRITPFEQIDFLNRFYHNQLGISKSTSKTLKEILQIKIEEQYSLSGKTGWSTTDGIDNGWFVGYVEAKNNIYFFATNIEPRLDFEMKKFSSTRKEVTISALFALGAIN